MEVTGKHFVEIEAGGLRRKAQTYRFYGRGVWKMKDRHGEWRTVNAIYVPSRVLEVAAAQCADD